MLTNKILFSDIIKFIVATIIILLGFLRKGENVGETQENIFFQDYLNKESIEEIHQSPTEIDIDKCENPDLLCEKIKTEINDETIIPYKNQVYDITHFIDDKQIVPKKIIETIKQIEIKNNDLEKRGYATRDTIFLNAGNTNNIDEFHDLSTHELGHIFDLGVIQGNSKSKNNVFTEFNRAVFANDDASLLFYKISRNSEKIRKNGSQKKDFCSGYGMTNPFEDFAECFNLFINHQTFFKFIAIKNQNLKQKYNFISTILQGEYLSKNTQNLSLLKENYDRRPRDTTKL